MKKVLSLVIVAGLFSAFMVGCTAPAADPATPATTETGTTAGTAPATEAPATK